MAALLKPGTTNILFLFVRFGILAASLSGFTIPSAFSQITAVSLGSSGNPVQYGSQLTLTATVTPSAATGKVTFYDGVSVLGAASVTSGTAALHTSLLSPGSHSLTAYANGHVSAPMSQAVNAVHAYGFQGPVLYAPGSNGLWAAVADFNSDGKSDVALAGYGGIYILLGNGDGTFGSPSTLNQSSAYSVATGDFNGDGNVDLAVQLAGSVSILLGNGNGTFQSPTSYTSAGAGAIAVTDLNLDGIADLVTSADSLLGNGDGTFQSHVLMPSMPNRGGLIGGMVVGDFNRDGKPDVATGSQKGVVVLFGNGDGTFTVNAGYNFTSGSNGIGSIVVADFNGDGNPDLAATGNFGGDSNGVQILLGSASGSFTASANVAGSYRALATGDFNADGKVDLAVVDDNSASVAIWLGNNDGTFQAPAVSATANAAIFIAMGDFNGDGRMDLALPAVVGLGNNLSVLIGAALTGNPAVSTTSLSSGTLGAAHSQGLGASGGSGTFVSWNILTGALPPGLTLNNSSGIITGTPTSGSGSPYSFGVTVRDSSGNTSQIQTVSISIAGAPATGPPPTITTTTLPVGTIGAAYSAMLAASGGTLPLFNWAISSGTLPNGLTLNAATGAISGTPQFYYTNNYTSTFSVTVEDSAGNESPEQSVSIGVASAVTVSTLSLPGDAVGTAYSQTLAATGGSSATYTWVVATGSLPPGLSLNSATGAITGTPTTSSGSPFSFTVTAADTAGRVSAAQSLSIAIAASTVNTSLSLSRSPNPAQFGATVTLTANVTPSAATGKVTFYDGVTLLGVAPVSGGTAVLNTILLSAGSHSLKAYFNGYPSYASVASAAVAETVNAVAGGGFKAPGSYTAVGPSDGGPYSVAVGDFNGDGKADLATTGGVALGNGDGTFQSFKPTAPVFQAVVAVADFNGDGKQDLLVAATLAAPAGVLLGNGDGTFQALIALPAGAGTAVAVADFNGDGIADVATLTGILLGNGDGTFQAQTAYPGSSGNGGNASAAVADFNGDGKADVIVTDAIIGHIGIGAGEPIFGWIVYLGNGDGTFQSGITLSAAGGTQVLTADFNGDGKTDLALIGVGGSSVQIYLGNGDGTFTAGASYSVTGVAVLGDFNGDGKPDIAVAVSAANAVEVLLGNGDGTFQTAVAWNTGTGPQTLAVGDFNGDGRADILSELNFSSGLYNTFSVLLGTALPPTITTTTLPVGTIGTAYSAMLAGSFGVPPYSNWTVISGALPSGLSLDAATGAITGTPTTATGSPFTFTVQMQDSTTDLSPPQALSITISGASSGGGGGGGGSFGTSITASTTSLIFNASPGTLTGSQSVTITNSGAPITFSVNSTTNTGSGWLSISPASGTIDAQTTVTVSVNAAGLGQGTYTGTANVSTSQGAASISVTLYVSALFTVAPQSLTFTYRKGDVTGPPSQSIFVFSNPTGSTYGVSASGGSWLSILSINNATAPGVIPVSINLAGAPASTASGTITITPPNGNPVNVPVTLTILPAAPPSLSVSPLSSSFALAQGSTATSGQISISNTGGGTLRYTAQASLDQGAWLSINAGASGSATSASAASLTYSVNPAGLAPNIYSGHITVTDSSGNQAVVSVTLSISNTAQSILLSQTGITLNAVAGGPAPPAQSVSVLNSGGGTMSWSAQASTISGGGWLNVSPASGNSPGGQAGSSLSISSNTVGLAAGQYYGSAAVSSSTAANSPESVSVLLNVAPAAATPSGANVSFSSGAVILAAAAGAKGSQNQQIALFNSGTGSITYTANAFASNGGTWLSVSPASGSLAPGSSSLTIQVDFSSLTAGVQTGTVQVVFADGTTDPISVIAIATGSSTTGSAHSAISAFHPDAIFGACVGGKANYLVSAFAQPLGHAAIQAGVAQLVRVLLVDDCGNPVSAGSALVTFSNGDPTLQLSSAGSGAWEGTWVPVNAASSISLQVQASQNGASLVQPATNSITVSVAAADTSAPGQPGGVVNAASSAQAAPQIVAPGSYVSIYGTDLSGTGTPGATTVPLPTTLNGTQLRLGGQPMPLSYAAAGQVNAVIPQNLNPNSSYDLVVKRGMTLSVPIPLTVAQYQPGIFTLDASGSGQGIAEIAGTILLAGPQGDGLRPVKSGTEYLSIYTTGLGPVIGSNGEAPPADGAAAPLTTLYHTIANVSVTIGGVNVPVLFSGLAPTLVALYQINVQVPSGVQTGSAVPLVVTVTDPVAAETFRSNTVTVAVQ